MSKRKRASKPDPNESADDSAVKDDMVHVTPDLLAGSPDIFAGKKGEPIEPSDAAEAQVASSESDEAPAMSTPESSEAGPTLTPADSSDTTEATEPSAPDDAPNFTETTPAAVTAEPVATPPSYAGTAVHQEHSRRAGSSTAIGIVLVVIGIFALIVVMSGVDLSESGWPLFIIIPGLTLMVAGFVSLGAVATIPGGIVTMLGVVLAYANSTGDWPIWAYGWTLVIPFGLGLGMYLQALRDRDRHALRTGRTLLFIGLMMFLIGFVLFESILGISGRDAFGWFSKAALPVLLIVVGAILLVRSVQRSRQS
jgi:uncharacterized membrane protein HdeD (DUF308 family)